MYAIGNPVNYTDPSGYFGEYGGLLSRKTLAATAKGAIAGAVGGFVGSTIMYIALASGQCGDDMKAYILSVDPASFIAAGTAVGALSGGFVGASGSIFGAVGLFRTTTVLTGISLTTISYDIAMNGLNVCNGGALVVTVALGAYGAHQAAQMIRNARPAVDQPDPQPPAGFPQQLVSFFEQIKQKLPSAAGIGNPTNKPGGWRWLWQGPGQNGFRVDAG